MTIIPNPSDEVILSQPSTAPHGADTEAERAALAGLLARVEAAEEPDRYIDCWLACALDGFFPVPKQWPVGLHDNAMTWRMDFCRYEGGGLVSPGYGGDQMVRRYSASLDAALALCELALPGWRWIIDSNGRRDGVDLGKPLASVFTDQYDPDAPFHDAAAPSPALALLAAMLKALIAAPASPADAQSKAPDEPK